MKLWVLRLLVCASYLLSLASAQSPDESRLLRLYELTNGAQWTKNTNWNTSKPICSWFGVTCDNDNGIISLSLPSNNLAGRIPKLLYELPKLKELNLKDNSLLNPGFEGLTETSVIEMIVLSGNSFTSMEGIGNATDSLKEVHLTQNRIKGTLPVEITALTNLHGLYLSNNDLTGTLPTEIGNMQELRNVGLYGNNLEGNLPSEIGSLQQVRVFTLAENKFTGSIPSTVEQMTSLTTFSLHSHNNQKAMLTGTLPKFENHRDLHEIFLEGNALQGSIPNKFLNKTDTDAFSITIGLTDNQLTGTVPLHLQRFESLQLDLVGNRIQHIPEKLCEKTAWQAGLVANYGCDAILCKSGYANEEGRQTHDSKPCQKCSDGSGSTYMGATSCSATTGVSEAQLLQKFYKDLRGGDWIASSGWQDLTKKSSADDVCSLHGIVCNDDKQVSEVLLANNGLVGTIPTTIFQLPSLQKFDVTRNSVTMTQKGFEAMAAASTVENLKIEGTHITTLAGIGSTTSLRKLNVGGLNINGPIPSELFDLVNLDDFHAEFSLFTGTLPTDVGKLSNLQRLVIYNNELTGPLPTELGLLENIRLLDLSENAFDGELPVELTKLKHLRKLHLHQVAGSLGGKLPAFDEYPNLIELSLDSNAFTGTLPSTFLSAITNKTQDISVSLRYNKLTGSIPVELDAFRKLTIHLEGNEIDDIPNELCDNDDWMDGEVGRVDGGCDAILCPEGTWNLYGRASSKLSVSCSSCPSSSFYGSTFCGGDTNPYPEKTILDNLYTATGGRYWNSAENWENAAIPICSREGITCEGSGDDHSGVTEIRLDNNNVKGLLPPQLFDLPSLTVLSFSGNDVDMDFNGIEKATKLEVLRLSNTKLDTLDGIENAPSSLVKIDFSRNQMAGQIPTQLFGLKNVNVLDFRHNSITGHLPTELGQLSALSALVLSENYLSGVLVPELGKLSDLTILSLDAQRSDKKLSGSLLAFDKNPQLTEINLKSNALVGSIPDTLLAEVAPTRAITVDLANNLITGAIPTSLNSFPLTDIMLADNKIDSVSDVLCDEDNREWMDGQVGALGSCDAILCPPGKFASFGRQTKEEECEYCPNFQKGAPYYGATHCIGADVDAGDLGEELTSERQVLLLLYQRCGGRDWYKRDSWTTSDDICTWYGITCHDDGTIKSINLSANNMVGTPPLQLFLLPRLESLVLSSNPITFQFDAIGKAQKLYELRLDATGLSSVEGLGESLSLQDVNLQFNELQGVFPTEVLSLKNLRSLNMANNKLSSRLPVDFHGLIHLHTLRLGSNDLTGPVPSFQGLDAITTIDLAYNRLSGEIPRRFLQAVPDTIKVSVDLASNKLTGIVPHELDRFVDMTLILRDNRIESLDERFCDNHKWNDGSVKNFGCNAILCHPGTYNSLGRQRDDETPCQDCAEAEYFGTTTCASVKAILGRASIVISVVLGLSLATAESWI